MVILRRGIAENGEQPQLPRRGAQQIAAAHDLRHAAERIVAHNGKLIGIHAVGASDDKIAAGLGEPLCLRAADTVPERDGDVRHTDAPRGAAGLCGALLLRQVAAGSGIEHRAVRGMGRRGVVQLAAGAVARVDQALLLQFCKMCGIDRASRALRRHLAVPVQPEPAEVPPQLLGIGRTAALRVKVLDAQQHTPAL